MRLLIQKKDVAINRKFAGTGTMSICVLADFHCDKGKVITTHHNSERSIHHRSPTHRMPRLLFSPRTKTLADKIMTATKNKRQTNLIVNLNYSFLYEHVWDQRSFIDARLLETLDREITTIDLIDRRSPYLSTSVETQVFQPIRTTSQSVNSFSSMIGPVPFLMLISRNFRHILASRNTKYLFIYFFSESLLSKKGQAKISSMNRMNCVTDLKW